MNYTKAFFKYTSQNMLGMVGVSIYILADTFFISVAAGTSGIAVLNLALPIYGLIFAIGSMLGVGFSTRFTIKRAIGDTDLDAYFSNAIFWALLVGIPLALFGVFRSDLLMQLMGADASILDLGVAYTRTFSYFTPFFMLNFICTAFVRNDGDPTIGMLCSLSGSLFNVLFDYIFMFPLGMGMKGAALATGISPLVGISVSLLHYLGKKNTIRLVFRLPSIRRFLRSASLGISAFIGEMSSAITTMVFNMLLLRLAGTIAVAAYGVIANLSLVAMAIFNGLSQGAQPLVSSCFGQGDRRNLKKLLRLSIGSALVIELLLAVIAFVFTDPLISIFNSEQNAELVRYAYPGMRLYFLGYLAAGINIVLVSYFAAVGEAVKAFLASILRGMAAISVCAIVMAAVWGINGVWLSFLAAELLTFLVIILMNLANIKKRRK